MIFFSALENRDGNAVERAMTQHLREISESVQLIRQGKRRLVWQLTPFNVR